jgi:DNA-binding CsgD family transcriptional regulator
MEDSIHPSGKRRHLLGIDLGEAFQNNSPSSLRESGCRANIIARDLVVDVRFTTAEMEICFGLLIGLSAKEIANYRSCSNRTVENHIANIKGKINVNQISPLMLANMFEIIHTSKAP